MDPSQFPRVTTILDIYHELHLSRWRGKVGNDEADKVLAETSWLGSLIHDTLTALEIVGADVDINQQPPEVQHAVTAYLKWKSQVLDHWTIFEQEQYSIVHQFRGTPDRVGVLKGDYCLTLVDFKTGNKSIKHKYQTAAYKILLAENGVNIERRLVIYLPTTEAKGGITIKEHTNHIADERGFLSLLYLYNNQ